MTEDEDREKEAMTKDGNRIVILSETMLSNEYISVTAAGLRTDPALHIPRKRRRWVSGH
jgi:hypothetical protein